jgi:hypothetical protein
MFSFFFMSVWNLLLAHSPNTVRWCPDTFSTHITCHRIVSTLVSNTRPAWNDLRLVPGLIPVTSWYQNKLIADQHWCIPIAYYACNMSYCQY